MSDDPSYYTTYSTSDGRTWVEPMPEHVRRELDACRAIDLLQHQIDRAQEPRRAAEC